MKEGYLDNLSLLLAFAQGHLWSLLVLVLYSVRSIDMIRAGGQKIFDPTLFFCVVISFLKKN
jgi:hypothetical protein